MNDDDEATRKVINVAETGERFHTVHSCHRPSDEEIGASVPSTRKARNACMSATNAGNMNAMTNLKNVV